MNGEDDDEDVPCKIQSDDEVDEILKEVEETKGDETNEETKNDNSGEADNEQEHLQLTVAESDKLDTSNVDNEDSLNLTIGEDEAKIFQDDVSYFFYI